MIDDFFDDDFGEDDNKLLSGVKAVLDQTGHKTTTNFKKEYSDVVNQTTKLSLSKEKNDEDQREKDPSYSESFEEEDSNKISDPEKDRKESLESLPEKESQESVETKKISSDFMKSPSKLKLPIYDISSNDARSKRRLSPDTPGKKSTSPQDFSSRQSGDSAVTIGDYDDETEESRTPCQAPSGSSAAYSRSSKFSRSEDSESEETASESGSERIFEGRAKENSWESWFVRKYEAQMKLQREDIEKLKQENERERQEREREKIIRRRRENELTKWLQGKRMLELRRRKEQARIEEERLKAEEEKKKKDEKFKERAKKAYQEWRVMKAKESQEEKQRREERFEETRRAEEKRRKKSLQEYEAWQAAHPYQRQPNAHVAYAHTGDRIIKYYDRSMPSPPTFVNAVPWRRK